MGRTKKQSEEVPQNTNIVEDATDGVSETKLELDLGIKQLGGVGDVTEKKLKGFGVTSLRDICVRGAREISEITGVKNLLLINGYSMHKKYLKRTI